MLLRSEWRRSRSQFVRTRLRIKELPKANLEVMTPTLTGRRALPLQSWWSCRKRTRGQAAGGERRERGGSACQLAYARHTRQAAEKTTNIAVGPDTRKILFPSFGHEARTWRMGRRHKFDIMTVRQCTEEADSPRAGGLRSIWTPGRGGSAALIKPLWKFSRFVERNGNLVELQRRWDWTPIFWHLKGLTSCRLFDVMFWNSLTPCRRFPSLWRISTCTLTSSWKRGGCKAWVLRQ